MRRFGVLTVVAMLALAMTAVSPAGAAPVEKVPYQIMECFVEFDADPDVSRFTGKDDRNWHVRGANNLALNFIWFDEAWVFVGVNETIANWNASWMMTEFGPVPVAGNLWGEFHVSGDLGEFAGSWTWSQWPDNDGTGAGKAATGEPVKVTLFAENPGWGEEPYPDACFDPGFVLLEVFTK